MAILFWAFSYAVQFAQAGITEGRVELLSGGRALVTGIGALVLIGTLRVTIDRDSQAATRAEHWPRWCVIGLVAVLLSRDLYDFANTGGEVPWSSHIRFGLVWLGCFLLWVAGSRWLLKRVSVPAQADAPTAPQAKQRPPRASQYELERRLYPEVNVSGFAHNDQEVAFFTQVAALVRPEHVLLDFGAGRGASTSGQARTYREWLQIFRGRCAHVDGCDVDPAILTNPTLDSATLIRPGAPLPYENDRFDIIVSRHVFEHIEDPDWASRELLRVLKPGGWICALTPNKWGYVALVSRLVPNRAHAKVLASVQPGREAKDVFPTVYRLNRPSDVRRHFGHAADVYHYSTSAVPSYHFGSLALMRFLQLVHWLTPPMFAVGLRFFIQKRR